MFRKKVLTQEEKVYDVISKLATYTPDEMDKILTLAKQYRTWTQKVSDLSNESAPENDEDVEE